MIYCHDIIITKVGDSMDSSQKKRYDFYISYSQKDIEIATIVNQTLNNNGYSSFLAASNIKLGMSFIDAILEAVKTAKAVIVIVTPNYTDSPACKEDLERAIYGVKECDRLIIPFCHQSSFKDLKSLRLSAYQAVIFDKDNLFESIKGIIKIYENNYQLDNLYNKLSEFIKVNNHDEIIKVIAKILPLLSKNIVLEKDDEAFPYCYQLYLLFNLINQHIDYVQKDILSMGILTKVIRNIKELELLNNEQLEPLKSLNNIPKASLLDLSLSIISLSTINNIKRVVNMDVSERPLLALQPLCRFFERIDEQELNVQEKEIVETAKKCFARFDKKEEYNYEYEDDYEYFMAPKEFKEEDKLNKYLFDIAELINKSNELFEDIGDKKETYQFLMCLRTSYERLKRYCEVVKDQKVMAYCIEKISDIDTKTQRMLTNEDKTDIKEDSFKALLGFLLPSDEKFDVFLSYKHHEGEDNTTIRNIYSFLKKNLLNVFLDEESLSQLGESEYYPATIKAVSNCKHLVILLDNPNVFIHETAWMKKERTIFMRRKTEGKNPNGNLIIIATDEVYQYAQKTNKEWFPEDLDGCHIIKISKYKEQIMGFLVDKRINKTK